MTLKFSKIKSSDKPWATSGMETVISIGIKAKSVIIRVSVPLISRPFSYIFLTCSEALISQHHNHFSGCPLLKQLEFFSLESSIIFFFNIWFHIVLTLKRVEWKITPFMFSVDLKTATISFFTAFCLREMSFIFQPYYIF